jgi:hypothetical protein
MPGQCPREHGGWVQDAKNKGGRKLFNLGLFSYWALIVESIAWRIEARGFALYEILCLTKAIQFKIDQFGFAW